VPERPDGPADRAFEAIAHAALEDALERHPEAAT